MEDKRPTRRKFIRQSALLTVAGLSLNTISNTVLGKEINMETAGEGEGDFYKLPPLPYAYDALEPHIDKLTMQIHHDKHHATYVTRLNEAFKGALGLTNEPPLDMLFQSLSSITDENPDPNNPSKFQIAIRNNGGGHYNHSMFWKLMKPKGGGPPAGPIADAINATFGDFEKFKGKMNAAAVSRFGSGWAWLVVNGAGKLEIGSTPNQDNPLMDISEFKGRPVIGMDVWEHAYYLKYQNKRADYLNAWWNVVNWEEVNRLFAAK